LLTPDSVRRLAWRPPRELTAQSVGDTLAALGARPWQVEITAGPLADALVDGSG
jgi:ribonuclease D